MSGTSTPIEEMDNLYGSATTTPAHNTMPTSGYMEAKPIHTPHDEQSAAPAPSGFMPGIPGLGMLSSAALSAQQPSNAISTPDTVQEEPAGAQHMPDHSDVDSMSVDGYPTSHGATEPVPIQLETLPEAPAHDDQAAAQQAPSVPQEDIQMEVATTQTDSAMQSDFAPETRADGENDATSALLSLLQGSSGAQPVPKAKDDPEFIEAAKAQQGDQGAEWQYNTSDEESSDTSSDDSSSSEDDSDDDDYEMLDPATAAKMLMDDAGDDDDAGPKTSSNHQVRTKNEKPEEIVPKPDVTLTPDMKVTQLGRVENLVDNMILVKANTSGEYQVLEAGSVLCLESREVIGAVAETLGRVQEPLYVVAFTKAADITDAGISKGTNIFYVNSHSTFVFTEPLKNLKGTDASNLHDEELPADEMDFSDDEAEAAYKKAKKDAKKNRNAERNGANAPSRDRVETSQTPVQPYTGGAINYDDEPEDAYTPLARPDNLQQILASGVPQVEERVRQPFPGRGRGDRGRGGRGRGDRGRGDRGRGRGGGGGDAARGARKGPSKSFPDNHNQSAQNTYQAQPLPQKPVAPQGQQQQSAPAAPQFNLPQFGQHQQFAALQQPQSSFQPQSFPAQQPYNNWGQAPNPQQYQQFQQFLSQFGGAQAGGPQQFQMPSLQPPTPGGSIPAGAFVNPNFFPGQQQQSSQYQQQGAPQSQGAPQGPSPEALQGAQELLRRLGGQPPQ